MTLRAALQKQGNSHNEVNDILSDMVRCINEGADPEELLFDQGLEPDYVFDLLDYAFNMPEPSEPQLEYPQ